jgi:hypothetical protein
LVGDTSANRAGGFLCTKRREPDCRKEQDNAAA